MLFWSLKFIEHKGEKVIPGGSVVNNLHTNAGEAGDLGSVPGLGRSPGVGNSNPLQYSFIVHNKVLAK